MTKFKSYLTKALLIILVLIIAPNSVLAYNLQRLPLQPDENNFFSSVIDSEGGYAYFGTNTRPCKIVKIKLADFTRVGSLSIPTNTLPSCSNLSSATMDKEMGYAYFTMDGGNPGYLARVRLSDFSVDGLLRLSSGQAFSSAIDLKNRFLYVGATPASGSSDKGQVHKIDLNSFTQVGTLELPSGLRFPDSMIINAQNSFLLLSGEGNPAGVAKINLQTFTVDNVFSSFSLNESPRTGVLDTSGEFVYIGTVGKPHIYKIRTSDLSLVNKIYVNTNDNSSGFWKSAISSNGLFGFFVTATGCSGAKLAIINLQNLQVAGFIKLIPSDMQAGIATISVDPETNNTYFGDLYCRQTDTAGNIYKLSH